MKTNSINVIAPLKEILAHYWTISRTMIGVVCVTVALSSLSAIAAPYVFSRLIDWLSAKTPFHSIILGFASYAVLLGLAAALQDMVRNLSHMSAESLGFVAATRFFDRLVNKTPAFFVDHNPAEIQSVLTRGEQALTIFIQLGLIVFIPGVMQIVLAVALLATVISFKMIAVVLVYGSIFVAFTYAINRWTSGDLDAAIAATQENAKFVGNAVNAMESLKHAGSDRWISDRFHKKAAEVLFNWRRFCSRRAGFAAVTGGALTVQFAITFAMLLPQYRAGALTIGDLVLFNAILLQLNQPFEMIGHAMDDIARSYAHFLPFARMWTAPEEAEPVEKAPMTLTDGKIVFDEVNFRYDNGRGIGNLSFTAAPGRITFLTGETGAGKSTVFKLALKSICPQGGTIRVDRHDLNDVTRDQWFSMIGVVPQDIMLLNDTVRANIILGRPGDGQRLRRAADRASILRFIEDLPDGFDTVVGERGLKLSGGERQRIALARALYPDPRFLFLDEASSALDEATERGIMDHIRRLATDVTVIAITHRQSMIAPNDHVVRLTAGDGATHGKLETTGAP